VNFGRVDGTVNEEHQTIIDEVTGFQGYGHAPIALVAELSLAFFV